MWVSEMLSLRGLWTGMLTRISYNPEAKAASTQSFLLKFILKSLSFNREGELCFIKNCVNSHEDPCNSHNIVPSTAYCTSWSLLVISLGFLMGRKYNLDCLLWSCPGMLALPVLDSCAILFLNNGGDKQTHYKNSIFSHSIVEVQEQLFTTLLDCCCFYIH